MRNSKSSVLRTGVNRLSLTSRLQVLLLSLSGLCLSAQAEQVNFVFFSDPHYGSHRTFCGQQQSAEAVLAKMKSTVVALPGTMLPNDGGAGAGKPIEDLSFIVCGGDIGNRMHGDTQSAAESWAQFERTWLAGDLPPVYLIPGNHDISNAIGYPTTTPYVPDATCVTQIYNRMMHPAEPRTNENFVQQLDKSVYGFSQSGIAFIFGGAWIDSQSRYLIERSGLLNDSVPAILFTHFPPAPEAFRFTNPHPGHAVSAEAGFQNVIEDIPACGPKEEPVDLYRDAARFIGAHPQIAAWLHGHAHCNFFYDWKGPDEDILVKGFQTDSPTLGAFSSKDETLVSYLVVSIDTDARLLTVRQYFWHPDISNRWGATETVCLNLPDKNE